MYKRQAGAVLEKIQSQELEETDTIDQLLSDMISLSDNEAANELVRYLSDSHDHRDGMELSLIHIFVFCRSFPIFILIRISHAKRNYSIS